MRKFIIKNIGEFSEQDGFIILKKCSDNIHEVGINGVKEIVSTKDKKVEFICYETHTLAYVKSAIGYPAYYPVNEVKLVKPVKTLKSRLHLKPLGHLSLLLQGFQFSVLNLCSICSKFEHFSLL